MRGETLIRFRTLSLRRRWSLAAAGTVIVVGAATGIYLGTRDTYSSGAHVEFVLGAGTGDAGTGPQLKVAGELQTMTTDRRGDVALFTRDDRGYELWMAAPEGTVKTVRIPALDHFGESATDQAAQSAASPDGSFYLALDAAGLWRVTEDGRATNIIKTARGDLLDDVPVAQFSPLSVNGVTVTDDGTVFFSDTHETGAVLVHRLRSGDVTKVAGETPANQQLAAQKGPNFLDPKVGGQATSVYLHEYGNAEPLAWNAGNLFMHAGKSVLRIALAEDRVYPVVAAKDVRAIRKPESPFRSFGKAINGYVDAPRYGDEYHASSIVIDPASGNLYYGAGDPAPSDTPKDISKKFRWTGNFTSSQREFFASLGNEEQVVYQVDHKGDLSAVTAGAEALSVANGYLYIAVDSCSSGEYRCDTADHRSAVVKLRIPGHARGDA